MNLVRIQDFMIDADKVLSIICEEDRSRGEYRCIIRFSGESEEKDLRLYAGKTPNDAEIFVSVLEDELIGQKKLVEDYKEKMKQ